MKGRLALAYLHEKQNLSPLVLIMGIIALPLILGENIVNCKLKWCLNSMSFPQANN